MTTPNPLLPTDDVIEHNQRDCVCLPTAVPITSELGVTHTLEVHHRLDGKPQPWAPVDIVKQQQPNPVETYAAQACIDVQVYELHPHWVGDHSQCPVPASCRAVICTCGVITGGYPSRSPSCPIHSGA